MMSAAIEARRMVAFWNYLPAFIAVAETEHLRNAARDLRMSPSSLSRMIVLLEHRIGYALFERSGRRLRLTTEGRDLLLVARQSLLMVSEALARTRCSVERTACCKEPNIVGMA